MLPALELVLDLLDHADVQERPRRYRTQYAGCQGILRGQHPAHKHSQAVQRRVEQRVLKSNLSWHVNSLVLVPQGQALSPLVDGDSQ